MCAVVLAWLCSCMTKAATRYRYSSPLGVILANFINMKLGEDIVR
jgi:hypothetical protein